jgi:hypothetical protein
MKYRTTEDIIIPAGAEVDVDPPHGRNFVTAYATVLMEIGKDITAEWLVDLDEAIKAGIIEEAEDDETD